MCDPIFCHEAEVVLTDDAAELTFYVAYPIPAFSDQGTDGTIKDVVFTVDGTEYAAESDITAKPEKVFDTDDSLFAFPRETNCHPGAVCGTSQRCAG